MENKKALLVTTVSGFVPQFEMNNVGILQEMGYEVHYAANYGMPSYGEDNHRLDGTGIVRHQIDFVRSPYSGGNLQALKQMKRLMRKECFSLVHCHTPMGSVIARLAAHATGTGPVIYTAHGFHFYQGAPLVNWLCYYPMERWLSRYTDQQICINQEDFRRASRFHARFVDYVPGVGIDLKQVKPVSAKLREKKRRELGIGMERTVILSAGELIKRKNHETLIRAMAGWRNSSALLVICGHGELERQLKQLTAQENLENRVRFLGYRQDMAELYSVADVFAFPSYQEGLPMALLEAMAAGLPVLCSHIRGSRDLQRLSQPQGRWQLCQGGAAVKRADDVQAYTEALDVLLSDGLRLKRQGEWNRKQAEGFGLTQVEKAMRRIYRRWERGETMPKEQGRF